MLRGSGIRDYVANRFVVVDTGPSSKVGAGTNRDVGNELGPVSWGFPMLRVEGTSEYRV